MDLSYIINELGEEREKYFNAVSPPIAQASNFAFDTVEELSKAFEDEMSTYIYTRGLNPTNDILRAKLAALDGAEDALLFNSGAAAIFAGVFANVKAGDHIVSVKEPYSWAQKLFDNILVRFGVTTTYVDGTNLDNWTTATRDNTVLFYLESPNSWDFAIQPLAEIAQYAKTRGILTMIDNSYSTPIYQQVMTMGIDISMQTATKYIGGHSDTLGGVLTGTRDMMRKIFETEFLAIGSGMSPFTAWLLLRGLRTMPVRLQKSSASAKKVIEYLKTHPSVERILYPLDKDFEQYELANRQMTGAGGLFTIVLKTKKRKSIVDFCEGLKHFLMAVSWGGHESLALPKCAGIKEVDFNPTRWQDRSVRFYIGLEDPAYLIEDLAQAFDRIQNSE